MVDTSQGQLRFSLRAVETLIRTAIAGVPGTTSIDAKLAGIGGRAYPRLLVKVDPERELISVDCDIAVTWPSPVTEVATATRAAIESAVRVYTGYSTSRVNVTVGAAKPGQRIESEQVSRRLLPSASTPRVRPARAIRHIELPQARLVRSISTPETERSTRSVAAPSPLSLREISTPAEPVVQQPQTPAPPTLRKAVTPPPLGLRDIAVASGSHEPVPVRLPEPAPLRTVLTPRPPRLNRVAIDPLVLHPRHVYAPLPEPLRAISINPRWKVGARFV